MDDWDGSLVKYLGQGAKEPYVVQDVERVASAPKVLAENALRLRAIYERFVGVQLTTDQALQKLKERTPIDCCHPIFIVSPHLIPIMIAARDATAYTTDKGLVGFLFDGPRDDGFPIHVLRLCELKGKKGRRKDIGKTIDKGPYLEATMIDLDKLVDIVYPERHFSEPDEVFSSRSINETTGTRAVADSGAPKIVPVVHGQLPLPGFDVYARLVKPKRVPKGTKRVELYT